jgi:UPF0755 protein
LKRILLFAGITILCVVLFFGYQAYDRAFSVNTPKSVENNVLLIPSGSTLEDVIDSLLNNGQIKNEKHFRWTASKMGYEDATIRKGRYVIPIPTNNKTIISLLRGGKQTPLNLTIQNVRTIDQLCGRVANKLEFDSTDLASYLADQFDSIAGTVPETRLTRFIPNTYEFYWTVTPEEFCNRMLKEYNRFWTDEKKSKAQAIGLTQDEVYTLASIIEKETNYNPEKSRMAGVYLNRIRDSIPLQADPTIVFALGDFELRRVLYGHLDVQSPYNTYRNLGLPPGPIFMPGIASIDAVLDREQHDYLYFCARPTTDGPGHAFASTLPAHSENARKYQRWLDSRGIQ